MLTRPYQSEQQNHTARFRWLALGAFVLTLLGHLIIIKWVQGELAFPSYDDEDDEAIMVELRTEAPPQAAAPRPVVRQAAPRSSQRQQPAVEPAPAPVADTNAVATQTDTPLAEAAVVESVAAQDTAAAGSDAAPALFDKISLPPPAELVYTVTAARDGRKLEGKGTINWQPNGTQYSITGEAGILFFTVLSYKSTGTLSDSGIAPELYVEKRFRKSETNTHFHRERKTISFSASTNSYESKGGEQDRASVIWQIASLGRGDSAKFAPGLAFDIMIAGARSASNWRVYVNEKEEITLDGKPTEAWHLTLMPTEQSYELKFELWLAPQKEWYPVKLHYADRNDGYLELLLTKLDIRR